MELSDPGYGHCADGGGCAGCPDRCGCLLPFAFPLMRRSLNPLVAEVYPECQKVRLTFLNHRLLRSHRHLQDL